MNLGPNVVKDTYEYVLNQSGANPITLGDGGAVNWNAGGVIALTGAQTISGLKTFSNGIISSVGITGTNLVFNTGAQTISGLKTFTNNIFAPTASFGTDTTQIATTAFVDNAVTSDQIMSTMGNNFITALKSVRSNEQNAGIYYFATFLNPSSPLTFSVKTSSGFAMMVAANNGVGNRFGSGNASNPILMQVPTNPVGSRALTVISIVSGGSVRSGNINEISMNGKFVTNFDGAGLSGLQSLDLQNNSLTSFSSSGLSNLTSLDLNSNSLTSFSASGMPLYVTFIDLSSNSLTSFSAAGVTEISILDLSNNSLTGVNMANVVIGGYYGSSSSYYFGLDVSNNNLDSAALNAMYTSLGSTSDSVINVNGNPGAALSDTSIANAKGYTVLGFLPV